MCFNSVRVNLASSSGSFGLEMGNDMFSVSSNTSYVQKTIPHKSNVLALEHYQKNTLRTRTRESCVLELFNGLRRDEWESIIFI